MVNFGGMETVPERYQGRLFYPHNPQVTLMRTTPAACHINDPLFARTAVEQRVPCHINDRCSPARRSSSTEIAHNEDRRHAAL